LAPVSEFQKETQSEGVDVSVKGKAFPLQAWTSPLGFLEAEAPEFLDNWHMKVVRYMYQ
jgi:hypothetical protein